MNKPNDSIPTPALLDCWRRCAVAPVWPDTNVHVLHGYFNACPESPDGRWVLLFVSSRPDAQVGDLCLIERETGARIVLQAGVEVEDAHRQANQQWICNGDFVVAMAYRDGQWQVLRLDPRSRECVVLCSDRQVFLGAPHLDEVPLYGMPWAPGAYGNLDLLHVRTGAVRTALELDQIISDHAAQVSAMFAGQRPDSIAYPVLSPDGSRVFFKLSRIRDGQFRSETASDREGLFVYDLTTGRSLGVVPSWGHPTWMPDSRRILSKRLLIDTDTMQTHTIPWYPVQANSHATPSPDGRLLVMDTARDAFTERELHWAIVVGDFDSVWQSLYTDPAPRHGTTSWRPAHPHPVFNHDGRRIYFNTNLGTRTVLYAATRNDGAAPCRGVA